MKIGIKLQSLIPIFIYCFSAEKQGFEPWEQLPVHRISSAARSTTPASLRVPRGTTVFKTAAIDHSATSPNFFVKCFCFSKAMQRYALFLNMQAFGQKKFEERKYSLRFAYLCRGII